MLFLKWENLVVETDRHLVCLEKGFPKPIFFPFIFFILDISRFFFHRKKHQTQRNSRIPGDLFEFQATSSATTLVETAELRGVSLGDVVKSCWNKLIVKTYTWWLLWWLLLLWWSSNINFRYYYGDHEYICTYILCLSYIVYNAVAIVTHIKRTCFICHLQIQSKPNPSFALEDIPQAFILEFLCKP